MNFKMLSWTGFVAMVGFSGQILAQTEPGFQSLFNGKDLSNWAGRMNHWSVQDGAITGITTKENPADGNNFLILQKDGTNAIYGDVEIRFSYSFSSPWGNS